MKNLPSKKTMLDSEYHLLVDFDPHIIWQKLKMLAISFWSALICERIKMSCLSTLIGLTTGVVANLESGDNVLLVHPSRALIDFLMIKCCAYDQLQDLAFGTCIGLRRDGNWIINSGLPYTGLAENAV